MTLRANSSASCRLALVFLACGAVAAYAQPRQPAPPSPPAAAGPHREPAAPVVTEAPQRTTATYGDWIVQCETSAQEPAKKVCEMMQTTQVQGSNAPFSRVAVGHPAKGQPVKVVAQVPVNASFAREVRIQAAADAVLAAPFARCIPNGCFAEFEAKDDVMKKFRAAAGAGKLSFADAGGREIDVPLSFKGFNQAFEALAKE